MKTAQMFVGLGIALSFLVIVSFLIYKLFSLAPDLIIPARYYAYGFFCIEVINLYSIFKVKHGLR